MSWFDPGADRPGREGAVAPGQHGVALLVMGGHAASGAAAIEGLDQVQRGQVLEVARADGTVLAWTIVDVVDLPAGGSFPEGLLDPVAEQRLVLLGCNIALGAEARDRFVLARRTG